MTGRKFSFDASAIENTMYRARDKKSIGKKL
jgi:hypothetical protein